MLPGPAHVGVDEHDALAASASDIARLAETTLLPSPGPVLVTTIDFAPASVDEKSTLVRMPRKASENSWGMPDPISGGPAPCVEHRNHSKERQTELGLELVGLLDAVVEILEEEGQADAEERAAEQRHDQVIELVRARRLAGGFGPIDHANIAGFQLAGNIGFRLRWSRPANMVWLLAASRAGRRGRGAIQLLRFGALLIQRWLQRALVRSAA